MFIFTPIFCNRQAYRNPVNQCALVAVVFAVFCSPKSSLHRWRYFEYIFSASRRFCAIKRKISSKRPQKRVHWTKKDIWKLWNFLFHWGDKYTAPKASKQELWWGHYRYQDIQRQKTTEPSMKNLKRLDLDCTWSAISFGPVWNNNLVKVCTWFNKKFWCCESSYLIFLSDLPTLSFTIDIIQQIADAFQKVYN